VALDQFELLRIKIRLVPQVVVLLRESRAAGNADPRADVKAAFDDATRKVALCTRLGLIVGNTLTTLEPGEWNAIVDTAALQM
jgi:hypothetical protein